jgi:cyclopropane fatty-acyl-phospholipid synthase-like methyltransferase
MNNEWLYNEFDQAGVTFKDRRDVEAYDSKQCTNLNQKRALVKTLGIAAGANVIEFGCGTGALAVACAEAGARVFAVDISEEMLLKCAAYAKANQQSGIRTIHSGFLNYQHEGPKADFVLSQAAFHHLPDAWKGFALARINGFMKLQGILYVQDAVYCFEPAEMSACVQHWIREAPKRSGWSREEYARHVSREFSTFAWIVEELLRRTGFDIIEKHYNDLRVGGQYTCRKVEELG